MLGSGLRRKQGHEDTMSQREWLAGVGAVGPQAPVGSSLREAGCCVFLPRKLKGADPPPAKDGVPHCRISWKGSLVRSASPPSRCPPHTALSTKPCGGTPLGRHLTPTLPHSPLQLHSVS